METTGSIQVKDGYDITSYQEHECLFIVMDPAIHHYTAWSHIALPSLADTTTDEVHQIKDDWDTIAEQSDQPYVWTGITIFHTKEDYAPGLPGPDAEILQEALPARGKRSPTTPSDY